MTLTKALREAVNDGPFQGCEDRLHQFFRSRASAEHFLKEFTEAREWAIGQERRGSQAADTSFGEQFWDGCKFMDADDLAEAGIATRDDISAWDGFTVYDDSLEADIHLRRTARGRIVVVDWTFKEDEYALDAWRLD